MNINILYVTNDFKATIYHQLTCHLIQYTIYHQLTCHLIQYTICKYILEEKTD